MEDKISVTFTVTASLMIIYLETFYGNLASLDIAITLLSVGIGLQFIVWGKIRKDKDLSKNEIFDIGQYSLMALAVMMFASFAVPKIFVTGAMAQVSELAITDQIIHGQVYAVSEEIFFRGAVLGFILWQIPYDLRFGSFKIRKEWFASALSAAIFALYHLAVYGYSNSTLYVLIAGFALGMITVYSKRLSPAMISHMLNNLISVIMTTGGS